ncbi:LysR family transcriptional regulator [Halalkalibacter alkaliphilus]|uniref:LysR family transcriptional regulator n=1 Tax=Halalkalibacter alkaliphilus TaxID=2917993 RepID=A0A9X2I6D1_9BACI|nr:LysR family transcriptional regulator [Halalkalibacter alkaliphilus]MCL7748538.1 LysR family transcriptional regulator [Halalkalibacter alkaliphilus]
MYYMKGSWRTINIESLRMFCLVVDEKSISKAAQTSFVSQPSVTRQIRAIEDFYGLPLFERKENKLTVTEAGRKLYPIAKSIINQFNSSIETMKRMNEENQFTLPVGASLRVGEYIMPKLLGEFKKKYPEAQLSLKIGDTKKIIDCLSQDLFQIAIVEGEFDHKGFQTEVLMEDELILIVGPEHPWRQREMIDFPEVVNEQIVRRIANSEFRVRVEKELKKHNLLEKISSYIELETTQAIKTAVEYGLGISFVSRMAVEKELETGRIIEVKINNVKITRPIHIVLKEHRFSHLGTEKFVEMVKEMPRYN